MNSIRRDTGMRPASTPKRGRKKGKGLPTLASLKKKAWKVLSRFVRSQAADYRGIAEGYTCGVRAPSQWLQAGHAIPGRTGSVLFDLEIIRPQCYRCNGAMRGQHHIFAAKLIREHGLEWWEQKERDSHKIVKWSRADLEALIVKYSA